MARGKYAAKAERRSEADEVERRALTAERERNRLAAELAKLREGSGRQISILRDQVAGMREQRDAIADPRMTELEAANRRLRMRMNAAVQSEKAAGQAYVRSMGRLARWLRGPRFGLSKDEVDELIFGDQGPLPGLPPARSATVAPPLPHPGGDDLRLVAWTEERAAVKRRAASEENTSLDALIDEVMRPIYVYDTAQSSFTIERDLACTDVGAVRVSIESPEPVLEGGAIIATAMLPLAEVARLAEALRESAAE